MRPSRIHATDRLQPEPDRRRGGPSRLAPGAVYPSEEPYEPRTHHRRRTSGARVCSRPRTPGVRNCAPGGRGHACRRPPGVVLATAWLRAVATRGGAPGDVAIAVVGCGADSVETYDC